MIIFCPPYSGGLCSPTGGHDWPGTRFNANGIWRGCTTDASVSEARQ